jgi:hypothetical protein
MGASLLSRWAPRYFQWVDMNFLPQSAKTHIKDWAQGSVINQRLANT